jgi:choline dehydrogenase-like flavoprotein
MQQTSDFRFTVLQGSCVGGSTTVNNAVCFDPPSAVLARWNDADHDAGLDLTDLTASVAAVRTLLDIHEQTEAHLNPSGAAYLRGAEGLPVTTGIVQANIRDCFGSGYCNIGCKWGRKLSMLDTALPWAQRRHGDRVRIVSDCEVERIETQGGSPKRVSGLRAKLADGRGVHVKARRYVLAAGAVASSHLLLRSGVDGGLPVGRRFSCNMGAPLHAELPEPVRAFDGLQISHFGIPREPGFVFETWFNPPVSQALNMPGWFERHFRNMQLYDHLMAVGVLVGTESNGRITRGLMGPGIDFTPTEGDRATLARGLKLLAELLFDAGASRVMLNTWGEDEITSRDRIAAKVDEVMAQPGHITLGTGHPQGGNAMSRDPAKGVVGPDFRVHGYEDLHVCDASIFPTSLTVNPQLTVMALAHLAARRMAASRAS